jgi:hypothetical protein
MSPTSYRAALPRHLLPIFYFKQMFVVFKINLFQDVQNERAIVEVLLHLQRAKRRNNPRFTEKRVKIVLEIRSRIGLIF